MSGSIEIRRSGTLARVVIDHPPRRNALTVAMWRQLGEAMATVMPNSSSTSPLRGEASNAPSK